MYKQYTPPSDYSIPNPLGPRLHNWRGGPLNEGSLYHGPVYTRPAFKMPWMERPLRGVGQIQTDRIVRDVSVELFMSTVALLYDDLFEKFEEEEAARIQKDGAEATQDRLYQCIRESFPQEDASSPAEEITGEELSQAFPREKVENTFSCFEGPKMGNLAIVLPLVAGGALLVWLFARK